jgi:paraquat-inducible protein B
MRTGDRLSYHLQNAEEILVHFNVALRETMDAIHKLAGKFSPEDEHKIARQIRVALSSVNQRVKPWQQKLTLALAIMENVYAPS